MRAGLADLQLQPFARWTGRVKLVRPTESHHVKAFVPTADARNGERASACCLRIERRQRIGRRVVRQQLSERRAGALQRRHPALRRRTLLRINTRRVLDRFPPAMELSVNVLDRLLENAGGRSIVQRIGQMQVILNCRAQQRLDHALKPLGKCHGIGGVEESPPQRQQGRVITWGDLALGKSQLQNSAAQIPDDQRVLPQKFRQQQLALPMLRPRQPARLHDYQISLKEVETLEDFGAIHHHEAGAWVSRGHFACDDVSAAFRWFRHGGATFQLSPSC